MWETEGISFQGGPAETATENWSEKREESLFMDLNNELYPQALRVISQRTVGTGSGCVNCINHGHGFILSHPNSGFYALGDGFWE